MKKSKRSLSALLVLMNLVVDLLDGVIDRRIKYE